MMSATSSYSFGPKPRVARADVPILRPEATEAGRGSKGTVLRLMVMPQAASRSSPCWPSISLLRRVDHHQMHIGAAGQHGDAVGLDVVGQ